MGASIATDTAASDSSETATITGDLYAGGFASVSPPARADAAVRSVTWLLDGKIVPGESGTDLVLPADSAGRALTAEVAIDVLPIGMRLRHIADAAGEIAAASGSVFEAPVPTISGVPKPGSTLVAQPGAWLPAGARAYQWLRDGAAIEGGTARTHVVTADDLGRGLSVRITGTLDGYVPAHRTSAVLAVPLAPFPAAPPPEVRGTPRVGTELSVDLTGWMPQPTELSYQWLRTGTPIASAHAATYRLTSDDIGAQLSVVVTARATGYLPVVVTSTLTPIVEDAPPAR